MRIYRPSGVKVTGTKSEQLSVVRYTMAFGRKETSEPVSPVAVCILVEVVLLQQDNNPINVRARMKEGRQIRRLIFI